MIDAYIRQYGPRLYGLCRSLCASVADADDLYQETWLKAVRCIGQYDPAREFEPWLTRICVNTYRSAWRRATRAPVCRFDSDEALNAALQAVPAAERADYSALYQAVNGLPEKLRLAVMLFYFRDLDVAATAAVLRLSAGTVKSRLHRARKLLGEALQHETALPF